MSRVTPNIKDFAARLIACETRGRRASAPRTFKAFRVCEKLRPPLTTLLGQAGFRALLSRALTLAGAKVSWLRALHVKPDGTLGGLDALTTGDPRKRAKESAEVLAELLGLLVVFVGMTLTVQLVREIWPNFPLPLPVTGEIISHEEKS